MRDSRVDKLKAKFGHEFDEYVDEWISDIEAAGLVVIDPDDVRLPGLIGTALWNGTDEFVPMASAHKVIAALRGQR